MNINEQINEVEYIKTVDLINLNYQFGDKN